MNSRNSKKIFTPNIVKHRYKSDISPNNIISPTAAFLNEQNKLKEQQINNNESNNTTMTLPKSNYPQPQQAKQIILKIKRKIDDEPLQSIVIERPKKKALLDTFKNSLNFNENENENENNNNNNNDITNNNINDKQVQEEKYIDLKNHEFHKQYKNDMDVLNYFNTLSANTNNNNGILDNNIRNNNNNNNTEDNEVKLFRFVTTLKESIINNNKIDSKVQERLEQLKGVVNSPKMFNKKKNIMEKKRKEIRYKQISINRNQFKSEEEREFFKVHDVIELERTVIEDHSQRLNHLSKEEEELLCNYKSMLVEDIRSSSPTNSIGSNGSGKNDQQSQQYQQYVYDYYLVSKDNLNIDDYNSSDLMDVERIKLDAEEDDLFDNNLDDGDDTSDDSENWYKEYPSDEDGSDIIDDDDISNYDEEEIYDEYDEDEYNNFTYNQYENDD